MPRIQRTLHRVGYGFARWVVLGLFGITAGAWAEPFEDVTESVIQGLGDDKAVWGDYNNDGWVDLYCGSVWRNEGGKKFTRVDGPFGNAGIWSDYDNDGDLDLTLHFGLGPRTDPVDIEVLWPAGEGQIVTSNVDTTVEIVQGE